MYSLKNPNWGRMQEQQADRFRENIVRFARQIQEQDKCSWGRALRLAESILSPKPDTVIP